MKLQGGKIKRYSKRQLTCKTLRRFLDTFHKDHYVVYNLCSERSYDATKFGGRGNVTQLLLLRVILIIHQKVARCGIQDHNCPTIESMESFCVTVVSTQKIILTD